MKNLLRLMVVLSVLLVLSSTAFARVPEGWLNGGANFDRAMKLHRDLKAPLVIYFFVDWCPYCNELENEYFSAPAMRDYLRTVIKIRVNPELTRVDEQLAAAFGIQGYPAFFVVAPNSIPIQLSPFRKNGRDLTPAEFAQRCREVATPRATDPARMLEAPKPAAPVIKAAEATTPSAAETAASKFVNNAPLPT